MVLNDAGIELTSGMKFALTRGLSFIPGGELNLSRRSSDLDKLLRSINLRLHWGTLGGESSSTSYISRILKSNWQPPEIFSSSNPLWRDFISAAGVPAADPPLRRSPWTYDWKQLTGNQEIYVIKADKGGKTVILSRENYRKMAFEQLDDRSTYEEFSKTEAEARYADLRTEKLEIIKLLLKDENITRAEAARLKAEPVKIPAIYFLPKVHKSKSDATGTFPGRPIQAACGGMLKSLDEYLANTTSLLLHHIPGSLMDTTELITDLAALPELPKSATLFSADVCSLYPNIPNEEAIRHSTAFYAANYHLLLAHAEKNNLLKPPKPNVFKKLLTLILDWNYFHFQDSRWFRQLKGTAMGCSMSVFIANAFMYFRTRRLVDLNSRPADLLYFGRYIDDIIGVWTGPADKIESIFSDYNVIDESIRLTYVIGGQTLEALDLLIYISNHKIGTRLFRKETAGDQFVHWDSTHPFNLKISIPYAQLLRLKRNCSLTEDFERESTRLLRCFRDRGYPLDVLHRAYGRATAIDRQDLLKRKPKSSIDSCTTAVFDFDYNTDLNLRNACRNFYSNLLSHPTVADRTEVLGPLLPPRIRVATRVGRSLGSSLGPLFKRGPRDTNRQRCPPTHA